MNPSALSIQPLPAAPQQTATVIAFPVDPARVAQWPGQASAPCDPGEAAPGLALALASLPLGRHATRWYGLAGTG